MAKLGIFLADGCEEIEALSVVDLCRRAGLDITMISVTGDLNITGSHKIKFQAETLFSEIDFDTLDGVVLPGGMPGTNHLKAHEGVNRVIQEFASQKKLVAAICAAPSVLGEAGLLSGEQATCHPGFESSLEGAEVVTAVPAVRSGCFITSRGMGTSVDFGLEIIRYFTDENTVYETRKHLVW